MLIYNVLEHNKRFDSYSITPFIVFDEQLEEVVKEECEVYFKELIKALGANKEELLQQYCKYGYESTTHTVKIIKSYFD